MDLGSIGVEREFSVKTPEDGSMLPVAKPEIRVLDHTPDDTLVDMWLHGHSPHTQDAYASDYADFRQIVIKPLREVTLIDLQLYADTLMGLEAATVRRKLASLKSLLSFASKTGYLSFNVGAALRLPKVKDTLAERILTESQVQSIIALEKNKRNRVMLRFLYYSGARVSEVTRLRWKDLVARSDRDTGRETGQATLFGKGDKTRFVLLDDITWKMLTDLRVASASADDCVFYSTRSGGELSRMQVLRIIKSSAVRAGIPGNVSPHWFRHSHATHALDRGAPVSLVTQTLGHASVSTTSRYLHARPDDSSSRYLAK